MMLCASIEDGQCIRTYLVKSNLDREPSRHEIYLDRFDERHQPRE